MWVLFEKDIATQELADQKVEGLKQQFPNRQFRAIKGLESQVTFALRGFVIEAESDGTPAKQTHLERLKETFDAIGVPYVETDEGEGYRQIHTCSREEQKAGKLDRRFPSLSHDVFFEFFNGELASSP